MWYESKGILRYSIDRTYGPKLIVENFPAETAQYYRSLIPKYLGAIAPRYKPHISVVRKDNILAEKMYIWGKHEGEIVDFIYGDQIKTGGLYFWLTVYSLMLEEIRLELGLPLWNELEKPQGFCQSFHITIANLKGS